MLLNERILGFSIKTKKPNKTKVQAGGFALNGFNPFLLMISFYDSVHFRLLN